MKDEDFILKAQRSMESASLAAYKMITQSFPDYSDSDRWLLVGRTVSAIFHQHYRMALQVADTGKEELKGGEAT